MKLKRKALLLISLIVLVFVSCRKETDNSFDCDVQGLENIKAKVGDTRILNVKVSRTQGPMENVTLSLKNVPAGVSYFFETNQGMPNYSTTLTISVANTVKLGTHVITLQATSENSVKSIDFNLDINDTISMIMKVYDATKWDYEMPVGELADSAVVTLYKDSVSFAMQQPCYSTITDSAGIANFYHLQPGSYLFTVQKGALSNIASKKLIKGQFMGFATINIDKYGQLMYRDQNGDGIINDADRVLYDMFIMYTPAESERIVWIGQ